MLKIVFFDISFENIGLQMLISVLKKAGYDLNIIFKPVDTINFMSAVDQNLDDNKNKALDESLDGDKNKTPNKTLNDKSDENNNESVINKMVEKIVEEILQYNPDIVGFSLFSFTYQIYRKIASRIKAKNSDITILFGGIHATLIKEVVLKDSFVDFAIIGEAEEAILEFLDIFKKNMGDYSKGAHCSKVDNYSKGAHCSKVDNYSKGAHYSKISNLIYRGEDNKVISNPCRPYIRNLSSLPFPDKSEYYKKQPFLGIRYNIMATRGCFFQCTYCSNNALHKLYSFEKNHIRFREPEHVIQELIEAKKKYSPKSIFFMDDIFTFKKEWLKNFASLYKRDIDLPLECITHPSFITPEVADILRQINTKMVSLGVQTADENLRRTIFRRNESNESISKAIMLLKERQISVAIDHIFDFPGETEESIKYSIKCYSEWEPSDVSINWMEYFPNTDIISIAEEFGLHPLAESKTSDIEIENGKIGGSEVAKRKIGVIENDKEKRKKYIKYNILMASIGVFPGWLTRFFLNHLSLVLPLEMFRVGIFLFSRLFVNRRVWYYDYIKLTVYNKIQIFKNRCLITLRNKIQIIKNCLL